MWPWEHLAFGYVLLSLTAHATWRRAPGGAEAVALALGTQTPDLIDKPLSWGLGLFPTGYALGHALVFAVPAMAAAVVVAGRRGRSRVGAAYAVGYASHLAGDLISPLLREGRVAVDRLLWPFVTFQGYGTRRGLLGRFSYYFGRFLHEVADPAHLPLVLAYLGVFLAVGLLWVVDGVPGLRWPVAALRSTVGEG